MNIFWKFVAILIVTFGLSGCGGKASEPPVQTTSTNGSAIKGPFVKGSQVVAYKLNEDGTRSITQQTTATTDNLGTYSFDSLNWGGATEIVIIGQYFNERTNTLAPSDSLSAIINISQGTTVTANINLFTHLAAMQTKTLMANNKSVSTAISDATQTVINNFALPSGTNLTALDPTKGSGPNAKANAELLRVSAALAGESSLIDALASAIADGNITNDSNGSITFANIAQKVNDINLSKVSNNLEQNLSITDAPDANDTNKTASYATNTHAPKIDSNSTIYIDENNIDIIEIGASDADGDTLTYSIVGGADSTKFTIDASTGALSFKTAPDFETPTDSGSNNSYIVKIQVSDGTLIDSKMITVYVTNIVETKPSITPFSKTVAENSVLNSTIGTLVVNAEDGTISKITLSGTNSDTFDISNAGVITLSKLLDYETISSYNLTVTATNEAGTSNSVDVNITVTNVAETKPTVEKFSTTISEGTPIGTSIGKLSFDAGDSAITSIILSGDGNQSFAISNDGNITVVSTLDYETKPNYSLNATLFNAIGSSIANIDINITNIAETKPTLTPISINVDENITINSTIGTIGIDTGDTPIRDINLSGSNSDTFAINNEGVITVVKTLDYETPPNSYELTAIASNGAGTSNSVDVNITINNINEAPVANDGNYTTSQDTNLTIDLKPLVSDVDSDNLSLKSFTNPSNGTVTNTTEDGVVIYTPNSGFSGNDSFTATVTDDGNLTATATIYITVTSNGIAVDPYIVGAKFWADVNQDNIQDPNEISTPSDINGTFKFSIYVPNGTSVIMISQGIHNGKIFDGNISCDFNASKNGIISPITSIAKTGFSDSEIRNLFILNGFDGTLVANELYMDPFNPNLLPLDGNMSNKDNSEIYKFRRVLLANLIINNTLTMNNGYDMNKSTIQSTFFTDPDGDGFALSPVKMMIDAGNMLDITTLREGNARVTARIFVTIFEYIRDQIKASFGNPTAMSGAFETARGDAYSIVGSLSQAYQGAYQAGMIDPKFGWVQNSPMLFVQPNDLGATDINITYTDTDTGNNVDITFMASGHNYYEGSTPLGQWQVTDDGKVQANSKKFEFLGDKINIYEGSAVTTYNITQVSY